MLKIDKRIPIGVFALVLVASLYQAEARAQNPPLYEQSLRTRVQQYYSHMQLTQYAEAVTFVTKATRDNFLLGHRNPFLSFSLDTIRFEPAGSAAPKKAAVTTLLEVSPFGSGTMREAETTNWVLEGSIWYLEAPKPHVATFQELTKGGGKQLKPASAEEIKFTTAKSDMGKLAIGAKGVSLFPFKNVADHPITLEVSTFCDCLAVKGLKKQYQPGESGELRLDFDTTNYLEDYAQSVFVKTMPGGTTTKLLVTGYVLRPSQEKPETPEKPEAPAKPEKPEKPLTNLP